MINVKVYKGNEVYDIKGNKGEILVEVLKRNGINVPMLCGGRGRCKKCAVTNLHGEKIISCQYILSENIEIRVDEYGQYKILTDFKSSDNIVGKGKGYAVIIDIGTTSLCFMLISLENGKAVNTISCINSQNIYGADVLTRISSYNEGKGYEITQTIKNDIIRGIKNVSENVEKSDIKKVIAAGNTPMVYFLMGYDCKPLGVYPFNANVKKNIVANYKTLLNDTSFDCDFIICSCISAFIGGDALCGGIYKDIDKNENSILIDLGTNGEIILNANGEIYAASAAAGPAFEGGNISSGIGSVEGAVYDVYYTDKYNYKTINDVKPVGICGTGLISAISCAVNNKDIDNTGLLRKEIFEKGLSICENIVITQNDIRQFQLAKAAVRAAIECLIKAGKISVSDIKNVYIGGGFGFNANIESMFTTGIFPKEFKGKTEFCGNTCLGGLQKLVFSDINKTEHFAKNVKLVELAKNDEFNSMFIEYMGL